MLGARLGSQRHAEADRMESAQPVFTVKSVEDAIGWYRRVLGFEAGFTDGNLITFVEAS